jgi:hypothetical protein
VNPSGYGMVEGKIPKEKKEGCFHHGDGGARNEGGTGCLQMLGNEGGCSARSHESVAKPRHMRMAGGIEKKRVPWGEKGTERDGGAWGEIRNEGEEKPTRARSKGR